MPANLEDSAVAIGLENVGLHSNPKERQSQRMFKLMPNFTHIIHYQKILKVPQARLQQYMNHALPDVQAEKAEEPEIKFPTSTGSLKKQESSGKKHLLLLY